MKIDKKENYEIPNYYVGEYATDEEKVNVVSGELIEAIMRNYLAVVNKDTGFVKADKCAFLSNDDFKIFMIEWSNPQTGLRKQLLDAQNLIFKVKELTSGK